MEQAYNETEHQNKDGKGLVPIQQLRWMHSALCSSGDIAYLRAAAAILPPMYHMTLLAVNVLLIFYKSITVMVTHFANSRFSKRA